MRVLLWLMATLALGCSDGGGPDDTDPSETDAQTGPWADLERWVCHPGRDTDVCRSDHALVEVAADGTQTTVPHEIAVDPGVDCFYVYPTVSNDAGGNSDFVDDGEESFVTRVQAGRYAGVCTVYAPLYRQVTNFGLFSDGDFALAYGDVEEAFDTAIATSDRPFLLLGHSQGSIHLTQLINDRIEADPALSDRFVAAHLLGGFVEVPVEGVVGGSLEATPLCESPDQTGCVVHYVSFDSTQPPSGTALFGTTGVPGREIACVDPTALLGRTAPAGSYPAVIDAGIVGGTTGPYADGTAVSAPYYDVPGLISTACERTNGAHYLAVTVAPDPSDPRTDDLGASFLAGWGLHLIDYNLAQRDLVDLAARQVEAF
jgi:hypothetical protein